MLHRGTIALAVSLSVCVAAVARADAPEGCGFCGAKSTDRKVEWLYIVKDSANLDGVYCESCYAEKLKCRACLKSAFKSRKTGRAQVGKSKRTISITYGDVADPLHVFCASCAELKAIEKSPPPPRPAPKPGTVTAPAKPAEPAPAPTPEPAPATAAPPAPAVSSLPIGESPGMSLASASPLAASPAFPALPDLEPVALDGVKGRAVVIRDWNCSLEAPDSDWYWFRSTKPYPPGCGFYVCVNRQPAGSIQIFGSEPQRRRFDAKYAAEIASSNAASAGGGKTSEPFMISNKDPFPGCFFFSMRIEKPGATTQEFGGVVGAAGGRIYLIARMSTQGDVDQAVQRLAKTFRFIAAPKEPPALIGPMQIAMGVGVAVVAVVVLAVLLRRRSGSA